jgi:hypothetical protein
VPVYVTPVTGSVANSEMCPAWGKSNVDMVVPPALVCYIPLSTTLCNKNRVDWEE